ncbi:hypothetical protein ANRL1_00169 [Anaerolineae bacterium]|nr:hypothetical protein ANRL1_00169 [Anaerolineae bacterium]
MDEFFKFTNTTRDQPYNCYAAVIHLVTAANGMPQEYTGFPQSHRPEEASETIQLDRWLHDSPSLGSKTVTLTVRSYFIRAQELRFSIEC